MNEATKNCPFCAEAIKTAAIKCRYCGEFLGDPEASAQAKEVDFEPSESTKCAGVKELVTDHTDEVNNEGRAALEAMQRPKLQKPIGLQKGRQAPRPDRMRPLGPLPREYDPGAVGCVGVLMLGLLLWTAYLLNNPSLVTVKDTPPPSKTQVRSVRQEGDNTVFEVTMPDGKPATIQVNKEGSVRP